MKVSVIGAGNVGGTLAQRIAEADLADVVLLDIAPGIPQGKAFDLADARSIIGYNRRITGTQDYAEIKGSGIVVITAGLARQPGMTREDLLKKNAATIEKVVAGIVENAPDAIILMVTNPLDVLTNIALEKSGFNSKKVIGMGGVLDSSRFANIIAEELNADVRDIDALVIGAHGQNMLPLPRICRIKGRALTELVSPEICAQIVEKTVKRGAQIVGCLGKGSAYYAPSAAAFSMVKMIINDEKRVIPACVKCEGQYGINDVCIGISVRLGESGIEEVIELELTPAEKTQLVEAAESVKNTVASLI